MRLAVFTAAHFVVDLGSAAVVVGRVCPVTDAALAVLVYNFFAFAVQLPIGLIADRLGRPERFAAAGCFVLASSYLLPGGYLAAAAAGLGNAMFHVGAGLDTLNSSGNRAGPLGLFVSAGAFGVYLGGLADTSVLPFLAAALIIAGAAQLFLGRGAENAPLSLPTGGGRYLAAALILAVVVLRSFTGFAASFTWKSERALLAVTAVAVGKALGGYLADRFGAARVSAASLLISAACFVFGESLPFGLAALCLFNMTMPVTLWAAARAMPGAKGFSFGLLTFGLFIGYLPSCFGAGAMGPAALAVLTAATVPVLASSLKLVEGGRGAA